jgi:hypothetical protein
MNAVNKKSTMGQIYDANTFMIHDLIAQYLPQRYHRNEWTHGDARIVAKGPFERTGIPADAERWNYMIEQPEEGWCFFVRAVWDRQGKLLKPLATHTVIEDYGVLEGFLFASDADIVYAVNCWLRTT